MAFNGEAGWVYLIVQPAEAEEQDRHALVLFAEVRLLDHDGQEALLEEGPLVQHLQAELMQTRGRLQTIIEEYETQHEELKAANEELQSINEEYKSATEELETSKEELQSVNEELQTVNSELKNKVEEISHAHTDLENLLASTEIATLFLDRALRIRRFTPNATALFHLRPSDQGRAIDEVKARMDFDGFVEDARQVLRTLEMVEREVADESDRRYLVRIRPYRTPEDKIDGVVLTFIDITERKRVEQSLQRALSYAETLISTIREPLLVLDATLRVQTVNLAFCETFAVRPEEARGTFIYELGNGQWDIAELRRLLSEILPQDHRMTDFEVTHAFEGLGRRTMLLNARQLEEHQLILLAIEDVTERHQARLALEASERRYRLLVEAVEEYAIFLLDEAGRVRSWNEGAARLLGYNEQEILGKPFEIIFTEEDQAADVPEQEREQARLTGQAVDERWQVRKGGLRFWASGILTALPEENGTPGGFVQILRDNTRQRTSEADLQASEQEVRALTDGLEERVEQRTKQVRRLASALVMAEQRERRRISAILHDHLQQLLFGAQLQVSFLNKDLPEALRKETDAIIQTLREAIDVTRTLTVDLSPPVLKGEGLDAALQWLAHQMQSLYNLKVEVKASGLHVVQDEDLRVLLFQLLRELLFNVVKHAGVLEARVELAQTDAHLRVSVVDAGAEFDVARALDLSEEEGHFGLSRIRERLTLFGGGLEIESSPNEGTRATLSVPL